jgi:hypothetical protein
MSCIGLRDMNWSGEIIQVPKYDPTDSTFGGNLQQVRVEVQVYVEADVCYDNLDPATHCTPPSTFAWDFGATVDVQATGNTPPVACGPSTLPFFEAVAPVVIGPADGTIEIQCWPGGNPLTGPPADGTCTGGDANFDHADFTDSSQVCVFSSASELLAWQVGTGPATVSFSTNSSSNQGFDFNGGAGGLATFQHSGRLKILVHYDYCPNAAPTCVPASPGYEVFENPVAANNSININLLDLVTDLDGCIDCSTFQIVTQPTWAEVNLSTTCTGGAQSLGDLHNPETGCTACTSCIVTYTPRVGADFCGMDTFTFTVMDDDGTSVALPCEVQVTVNPVNEPPVCVSGSLGTVCEGQTIGIDLRPYVKDPDDGPDGVGGTADDENCGWGIDLTSMVATSNCTGAVITSGTLPGTFRFKAPTDFCGPCTVFINACDSGPGPEPETAQLCIDPPGPLCGVSITILAVNEPPICATGPALPNVCEGGSVDIDFRPYVTDPDGVDGCGAPLDNMSITPSVPAGFGSFARTVGQPIGWWTYTVPLDKCGQTTVSLTACDTGTADACNATGPLCLAAPCALPITIIPINEPPVCVVGAPPLPNVCEGGSVDINFRLYVSDPDFVDGCGAPLNNMSITPSVAPGFGTFIRTVGQPTGWWTYTAPFDKCGPVPVSLAACDSGVADACNAVGPLCLAAPCPLSITIIAVNEPPVCKPGPDLGSVLQGATTAPINFGLYVEDPDDTDGCGAGLNLNSLTPFSPCGTFTAVPGQAGWFTFAASATACGPCPITVNVCDLGTVDSCNAVGPLCLAAPCALSIDIVVCNDPPVCVPGPTLCCLEDQTCTLDLAPYVMDPNDDGTGCAPGLDLTNFSATSSCGGVLVDNDDGTFDFTPPPDFCGPCQITLTACDEGVAPACVGGSTAPLCVVCVIDVCVEPVNDCPIAMDDTAVTTIGNSVLVDLCSNDSDPDGNSGTGHCGCALDCNSIVIVTPVQPCGTLFPDASGGGKFIFTPAADFVDGQCCFDYVIRDNCTSVDPTGCGTGVCNNNPLTPCPAQARVCITVLPCLDTNHRFPSSLLLYPEYDNRSGMVTLHTVTNTSSFQEIAVMMEYVEESNCSRSIRTQTLTPGDTFSFMTSTYIWQNTRGYSFMYAVCGSGGPPVVFNNLIGQMMVVNGFTNIDFAVNAVGFRAVNNPTAPIAWCGLPTTELTGDTIRNLDNVEYEPVPDQIFIPRFLGETNTITNELILIALSGGKEFTTTADFWIYNDNESVFSGEVTFDCWDRVPLLSLSGVVTNSFLANSNNDPLEVLGAPSVESGWIRIDGGLATSSNTTILDPAVYAVLIESAGIGLMAADLPWGRGCQNNGALLPTSLDGTH